MNVAMSIPLCLVVGGAYDSPERSAARPYLSRAQERTGTTRHSEPLIGCGEPAPALTSEPEASQAARLNSQHDSRRSWLDAIHVPRWWSLRRCIEGGGDARAALVGFRRPTVVCPRLRDARPYTGLGHPRSVTLDADVCIADPSVYRPARTAPH